ncbi:MAG TPA: bb3-type cytochrome oxidase subunit III [Burkholderiaceae bacterium]|nr:bb3-type cytochrome oxidase subunit III [Burkholderiaceae bacterium]
MNTAVLPLPGADDAARARALSIGLWAFILVATTLFGLFLIAYVMRLAGGDSVAIALPPQLWLSTALLVLASVLMQRAVTAPPARALLAQGGLCALAFLAAQCWAWLALQAAHVGVSGNPAASFFYLLTALHGLHVAGGLLAWGAVVRSDDPPRWRIALCARYWHLLLAVWLALYAAFNWITPDIARVICGVPR